MGLNWTFGPLLVPLALSGDVHGATFKPLGLPVDALWPLWRPCGLPLDHFWALGCPFRVFGAPFGCPLVALRALRSLIGRAQGCMGHLFRNISRSVPGCLQMASLSPCYLFHYPIPLSQLFRGTLCESDSHSPQAGRPNHSKLKE